MPASCHSNFVSTEVVLQVDDRMQKKHLIPLIAVTYKFLVLIH